MNKSVPTITFEKRFSCVESFNAWMAKRAYRTSEDQRESVEEVVGVCNVYTPRGDGSFSVSHNTDRVSVPFVITVSANRDVLSVGWY